MASVNRILLLCLLSAVSAANEIKAAVRLEKDGADWVVSSPMADGNFLFRVPGDFRRAKAPAGEAVHLTTGDETAGARISLRIHRVGADKAAKGAPAAARGEKLLAMGAAGAGEPSWEGERDRSLATLEYREGSVDALRFALCLADGDRLYVLTLDCWPRDHALLDDLRAIAHGFSLLETKGLPPAPDKPASGKPEWIAHAYYRLNLMRPAGFATKKVDPAADKGIYLHLRRVDEQKNVCDIRVRVLLKKTVKQKTAARAQMRIDVFANKYPGAKVPRKPKRARWPGADEAYRFKLAGKTKTFVFTEEWRLIEHGNGRLYEIQMTMYGAAERAWKKDLRLFWKQLKITR